jgi:hypothetical protein
VSEVVILLVIFGALGILGTITAAGNALDFGGPLRNLALGRAARQLARGSATPETIERSYWRADEYVRDSKRLSALGYYVSTESVTPPIVSYSLPGRGRYSGRTMRRRVPMYHVIYARSQTAKPS